MDILKILKNKPAGTKLYTPLVGDVYLKDTTNMYIDVQYKPFSPTDIIQFDNEGRFNSRGETILFPSKEMKDWSAFMWNKEDLLTNFEVDNSFVRFWEWTDDKYTTFKAKSLDGKCCNKIVYKTIDYIKVKDEEKQKIEIYNLRPGQKVLIRDSEDDVWSLHFFSHYFEGDKTQPICFGGDYYLYTIPYKGNQDLLGTTKSR